MEDQNWYSFEYIMLIVLVCGILGNMLVIISILSQKNLLKKNYYFLVLQLAICDCGTTITFLSFVQIPFIWPKLKIVSDAAVYFLIQRTFKFFTVAGIIIMLVISITRYHAIVQPLKLPIARRTLEIICGFVYFAGLVFGYGMHLIFFFSNRLDNFFPRFYQIMVEFVIPTSVMAVVYYNIGRALVKQKERINQARSTASMRKHYLRDCRICFVCILTVVCYASGHLVYAVVRTVLIVDNVINEHLWLAVVGKLLEMAGSSSANPVIYGILDKNLLAVWKIFGKKTRRFVNRRKVRKS